MSSITELPPFEEFSKIPRLSRDIVITEKIDGTNGQIYITEDLQMFVGSRTRWLTPKTGDNHGLLLWAMTNKAELLKLGPGRHYGEWWGSGINRGYGLPKGEKRFSLFNTHRWSDPEIRPACCYVVPVIYTGPFVEDRILHSLDWLATEGSQAAPGFKPAEGIVIFHTAGNLLFKKTILKDEVPKNATDYNQQARQSSLRDDAAAPQTQSGQL